jgi:hypothetical protein
MELVYKKDKLGKDILCDKEEKHQVMMEWEKPYMEESIKQLNPFAKVLEIGFGLGYTATKICSFTNVTEYNVIECTPIVWDKFEEFKSEQRVIRPELKVNLIKGRWEDVLQTTGIYDCIYFDDYVLSSNQVINDRFREFLYNVLLNHTRIGSRISVYSNNNVKDKYNNINCIKVECTEYKIDIPEYCKYAKGEKMYIPILTKIADADVDLREKMFKSLENMIPEGLQEQIKKDIEKRQKYKNLAENLKIRNPNCGLIVINNFYANSIETRDYVLTQEFKVRGNYPGQRTQSFANQHLKDIIQEYVLPYGGKITDFPMPNETNKDNNNIYNGSFQYTTSRDRSWVHIDGVNNWAGVLFMTPDAPLSGGTAFYKFYDGTSCKQDMEILDNKTETDKFSQDLTKWQMVDNVGNVFNRLILFNSNRFHMSQDYFGDSKENGRLFQVFFFSTEK